MERRQTQSHEQWSENIKLALEAFPSLEKNIIKLKNMIALNQTARADIVQISLIAERHSGSTWFTAVLEKAFPDVEVQPHLCRFKHWFQDQLHTDLLNGDRTVGTVKKRGHVRGCFHPENVIVINLWRNAYDWLWAMYEKPWHAGSHSKISFEQFVKKEWSVDQKHQEYLKKSKNKQITQCNNEEACIQRYLPGELDFCCNLFEFIYETPLNDPDVSEAHYDGPYSLREAKIKDYLAVKKWSPHFHTLQYESLVIGGYEGLFRLFHAISTFYNIRHNPHGYKNLVQTGKIASFLQKSLFLQNGNSCRPKSCSALKAIESRYNTDVETRLGYNRNISFATV